MAEVAGLVIGGVGLAALFDSCMNAFEYVEAGRNYGGEYQKSALKLNLLRLRLSRWGSTVRLVEDASGSQIYRVPVASAEEAAQVEELLGDISAGLEEAEKTALRHRTKKTTSVADDGSHSIASLTEKVRTLAIRRQKNSTLGQKLRWALHDQKKLERLIDDINGFVRDLVELFPSVEPVQQKLAVVEATELIHPSEVEEPADLPAISTLAVLEEASSEVDPTLEEAIKQQAPASSGHSFRNMEATGESKMANGDLFVKQGFRSSGESHTWDRIKSSGKAQVQNGPGKASLMTRMGPCDLGYCVKVMLPTLKDALLEYYGDGATIATEADVPECETNDNGFIDGDDGAAEANVMECDDDDDDFVEEEYSDRGLHTPYTPKLSKASETKKSTKSKNV